MAKSDLSISGLSMSYIFTFDLGSEEKIRLADEAILGKLGSFISGSYVVGKDEIRKYSQHDVKYIESYHDDMYKARYKQSILPERNLLLLQFPPLELSGLSYNRLELVKEKKLLKLDCTSSLNAMGVGSLVFWLDLEDAGEFDFEELKSLRDVRALRTNIDWRQGPNKKFRLNGNFSLLDLARFMIICLFTTIYPNLDTEVIKHKIENDENIDDLYDYVCQKCSGLLKLSQDIQSYPIYHINFMNFEQADSKYLQEFVNANKAKLRGIITGDLNWDKKKAAVVDQFFSTSNFSTRESIYWITHPNGSMKAYSRDLETSILTSKILVTFELEIIVTMKYFIYKIIRNLNDFSNVTHNTYPLRAIAKLRDREMRRLDEFYNMDFLQKDTTVARLDKFKKMFMIDETLDIAVKKFESLNTYMATEFEDASSRRQLALTVIFGVLGTGSLIFEVLREAVSNGSVNITFTQQILVTILTMIIAAVAIIIFYGKIKMR